MEREESRKDGKVKAESSTVPKTSNFRSLDFHGSSFSKNVLGLPGVGIKSTDTWRKSHTYQGCEGRRGLLVQGDSSSEDEDVEMSLGESPYFVKCLQALRLPYPQIIFDTMRFSMEEIKRLTAFIHTTNWSEIKLRVVASMLNISSETLEAWEEVNASDGRPSKWTTRSFFSVYNTSGHFRRTILEQSFAAVYLTDDETENIHGILRIGKQQSSDSSNKDGIASISWTEPLSSLEIEILAIHISKLWESLAPMLGVDKSKVKMQLRSEYNHGVVLLYLYNQSNDFSRERLAESCKKHGISDVKERLKRVRLLKIYLDSNQTSGFRDHTMPLSWWQMDGLSAYIGNPEKFAEVMPFSVKKMINSSWHRSLRLAPAAVVLYVYNESDCFSREVLNNYFEEIGYTDLQKELKRMQKDSLSSLSLSGPNSSSQTTFPSESTFHSIRLSSRQIKGLSENFYERWERLAHMLDIPILAGLVTPYEIISSRLQSATLVLSLYNQSRNFSRKRLKECCMIDNFDEVSRILNESVDEDAFYLPENVFYNTTVSELNKTKTGVLVLDVKGGHLCTADTCCSIEVPRDALQNSTRLSIRCIDPVHFYQPLIDSGLYSHVKILGHVHELLPHGQTFLESVTAQVTLPEAFHQSEEHILIHGRLSETNSDIIWEDITDSSTVHSTVFTVNLHHFSYLLALESPLSFARELFLTYFNYQPDLFRFMVLIGPDPKASDPYDVRLVALRESFYSCADKYSICQILKDNDFRVLYGKRSEYIYPNEPLKVCLEFAHGSILSCPADESYVAKCPFGGEEVGQWKLDARGTRKPLSGSVTLTRSSGQVYRFQFWEHAPMKYVQDVLKFATRMEHLNMIPIAKAVGLDEVEITELVEKTSDGEEQLKTITEYWQRKAENHELASQDEFITLVSQQAVLVSDRGKFHIGHLNYFKDKWEEKNDRDGKIEGNYQFFRALAKRGIEICQSVFSDCLMEIDQSEEGISKAKDVFKSLEKLFEHITAAYPDSVSPKLEELLELRNSVLGSQKSEDANRPFKDTTKSQMFCQQFADCVPWLIQVVKGLFKVNVRKPLTGMWGIIPDVSEMEAAKNAEKKLPSNKLWCRICEVLRALCEQNRGQISADVNLEEMENAVDILPMLRLLSICDKEWDLLTARVHHFRHSSKDIINDELPQILRENLQNVLQWLQCYVKFCPTRLVQFTFVSLPTEAKEGPLKYDNDSMSFIQNLTFTEESQTVVDLKLNVSINVNGYRHSEVIEVSVEICEQAEASNAERATLSVVYKHRNDGTGFLKILDKSQQCLFEKPMETSISETDGQRTSSETKTYKEGSILDDDFHEIAKMIPKQWKELGRVLLDDSAVDRIDVNGGEVGEKTYRMLKKWKEIEGSSATYEHLHNALCKVERKDLAETYCLEHS